MNNSEMEYICTIEQKQGKNTYPIEIYANKLSLKAYERYLDKLEEFYIKNNAHKKDTI